jgi:hypothetical protein
MRRFASLLLLAGMLFLVFGSSAKAVLTFRKEFEARYNVKEPQTDAEKALAEKVAVTKCFVCHVEGAESKEAKNAYGTELGKLLDKDNFSLERRKAEPDKVKEEIQKALEAVEAIEAAGGETYGSRIKAGKLPVGD